MPIHFHFIEVPKINWKVTPLKNWIKSIAASEGFNAEDLSYVFCTDEYLLDINIQHLDHHTLTDIITFDLSDDPQSPEIEGEIYISLDRVKENAVAFNVPFESEISRVLAHGVLHLCGYKDKTTEEEQIMRTKENHYIASSPLLNVL